MKFTILFIVGLLCCSCQETSKKNQNDLKDVQLDELYSLMQGSFNSGKQAQQDSTYFDISLHMYPIWEDKGKFLYVEQALSSNQDRPYRQRVYELTQINDSVLSSAVYRIPNDSLWIGKWKTPSDFDSISPSDLSIRDGCAVLLKRIEANYFKGTTLNDACKSALRGASYATSKVEITSERISSWDQGFDASGNQVWGAEKGGYVFDKNE